MILGISVAVVEGDFILATQVNSLMRLKEHILDKIRPQLVGLLDSFLVPETLLRSALTSGDPYQVSILLCRITCSWLASVKSTIKFCSQGPS